MIKGKSSIVTLCFILLSDCLFAQTRYISKNLDDSDGLLNTDVWDVYQDNMGYYWIATLNGLSKYDGYKVQTYQHSGVRKNSLVSDWCLQLLSYKNDYLVVNNYSGFSIYRYEYDDFVSVSLNTLTPQLENCKITNIICCTDQKMIIGINNGYILIIESNELDKLINNPDSKINYTLHAFKSNDVTINSSLEYINLDAVGNLWLCYNNGLFVARGANSALPIDAQFISPIIFNNSYLDNDGRIWFCAYNGDIAYINSISNQDFKINILSQEIKKQVQINFTGFGNIIQGANKNYYITLNNAGFITVQLKNGIPIVIDHAYNEPGIGRNDIISNNINSISISENDVLCLSTSVGVTFINLQSLQLNNYSVVYKNSRQPFNKSITKIIQVKNTILCGTESDGVFILSIDTVSHVASAYPWFSEKILIYDLLFDSLHNTLYIATENGLYLIGGNELKSGNTISNFKCINRSNYPLLKSNVIISLTLDKNNILWIGTGRGLNYYDVRSNILMDVNIPGKSNKDNIRNIIRDVVIDDSKVIWLATESGLVTYDPGSKNSKYIFLPDSSDEQKINSLFIDSKKQLWVGTSEGLYVRKANETSFIKIDNPYSNFTLSVKGIEENESGQIWITTGSGLYKILDRQIVYRFSKNDGLNSNVFNYNSILHTSWGFMIVGNKRGIHLFDEDKVIKYPFKSKLIVSDLRFNDKSFFEMKNASGITEFRRNKNIVLPAGSNSFTISFALLGTPFSENVIYQYKLEDINDEWTNIGSKNEINFSNIKHGCYNFQVRASIDNHDWIYLSEQVKITISPYFYQTWWFKLSVGFLLAFLLSIFIFMRFQTVQANREKELAYHKAKMTELFLANMNHEIRTPLNAIHGFTKLLIEKQPRNDQYMYLHAMQQSSEHLIVIINDILDIAKIDSGKMKIEPHTYDMDECVQHVESSLKVKAIEKNIAFRVHRDESVPKYVYGDSTRFIQVLFNLASNAIKFTEKGSVDIHIHSNPPEDHNDKPKLFVKVSDTGIGIDKSKYPLIFESFTQADNETTRKYGGTGLGLAICKSLIELQGGKIWFESEVGKGTTFYFELPYTPSSGDSVVHLDKKSITRYANEMDGMRILLVEDNDFNRIVASETVKYYFPGVTIETAVNGLDAIKKYRVNDYDLIIMDIQMPEMDGYEATNFIRTQFPEDKRDIHILAMSANALQPDIARVYESGMNDFLPKPFEVNDMALKMSIAYRQKKLKATGATTING